MPNLVINGQSINVPSGTTILNACEQLKIQVPTLCYLQGYKSYTSCMICMVKDKKSDKLIPSCTALAEEGKTISVKGKEWRDYIPCSNTTRDMAMQRACGVAIQYIEIEDIEL